MATHNNLKSILILIILLTVIPLASSTPMNTVSHFSENQTTGSQRVEARMLDGAPLIAPGPNLGITNWTHNHIENPGLEIWPSVSSPRDWSVYRTPDRYSWFATEPPHHVSEGDYSAGQQIRSSSVQTGWSYWYQSGLAADMRNLTLDLDWYVGTLPDTNWDYFMVYLRLNDGTYIYYYLVGANGLTLANSSWQVMYRINGPLNTWNNLYRNLTADYLAAPGFPLTISPGLLVINIYCYLQAGPTTYQLIESYFDDVKLQNETSTFIGGATRNGNLETGTFNYWYSSGRSDESYVLQSSTAHTGVSSANLTAFSNGNSSTAHLYQSPYIRITDQNQGRFSCWWQLNQDQIGNGDYAMVNFEFYNFTDYFRIWYLFGYGGFFPYSNSTNDYYFLIDEFNTTGSWQYFERNIWQEKSALFGPSDAILNTFFLSAHTNNAQARVELLIDDVKLSARAITVANFEDQRAPGTPIYGWDNQYSTDVMVTDQGYGGGKAANCSIYVFDNAYLEQDLHRRPLNSTRETYLDAMWRLEDFSLGRIMFHIEFSDYRDIYYFLGISDWSSYNNDSSTAFYNVTGSGTLGTWIQMHRDLVHDYEAAFGSLPNLEMMYISFYAESDNAALEVLFDDLYLYDDPAPILSNVVQSPLIPNHGQAVQVEVDIEEHDVDTAWLFYRVDGGIFTSMPMTHQTGNTYRATIAGQPYNTVIDYYFQANDTWGLGSTLQDGATYFSYTVDDLTNPTVSITAPTSGDTVSGTINVEVTATDGESGINHVEFAIDGGTVHTDSSAPYSYTLDTTPLTDASHTISVTALDNEDNENSDSITITVSNQPTTTPPPPAIPGFPIEALILGIGAALGVILIIRRHR